MQRERETRAFMRNDGRTLRAVRGFREQVLSYRSPVTPKQDWTEEDYSAAADKKLRRMRRWLAEVCRWRGAVAGARVLEVGCGDGINCLLIGLHPVRQVVGIDRHLPLFDPNDSGERARRLASSVFSRLGFGGDIGEVIRRLPARFALADATLMAFSDDSFDLLVSRSVMEHLSPLDTALAEMARVVRPGGLLYHSIDPYFWLRGCHKTGVVAIPWAHSRLSPEEFHRFVAESEGEDKAIKRCQRLKTLNQLTLTQWRKIFEEGSFEILEWNEEESSLAETLLVEYPEVEETLLEGVERRDLTHSRIRVWLRRKGHSAE